MFDQNSQSIKGILILFVKNTLKKVSLYLSVLTTLSHKAEPHFLRKLMKNWRKADYKLAQQLAPLRHDKFEFGTKLVTLLALISNHLQKANLIFIFLHDQP